MKIRQSYS